MLSRIGRMARITHWHVSMVRQDGEERKKDAHIIELKMNGNCRPGVVSTSLESQVDRQLFQPLFQVNQYRLLAL